MTTVHRAATRDDIGNSVTLRAGAFDELSLTLPAYLHNQAIAEVEAARYGASEDAHRADWAGYGASIHI